MTSILYKAIEAIEKKKYNDSHDIVCEAYDRAIDTAIVIICSLLPAEKEQRKEDMRKGWFSACRTPDSFETWYNKNEKG